MGLFTKSASEITNELTATARDAYARGDLAHFCTLPGMSSMSGLKMDEMSLALSKVAAEGWEPVSHSINNAPGGGFTPFVLFKRKD